MNWYAAHIVMLVRLKDRTRRRIPAWENIVLIQATDEDAALAQAESIGLANAGDEDDSFRWGGKPAIWEFGGVRKVTECALAGSRPGPGDEVTYTELEFESLQAAKLYAAGESCAVKHTDQIRDLETAESGGIEKARRKRA